MRLRCSALHLTNDCSRNIGAVLRLEGRAAAQVGLSLSLFVLLDRQIADVRFRSLAVFFMGAQALLTLVIQGTTMPWLLQAHGPPQLP